MKPTFSVGQHVRQSQEWMIRNGQKQEGPKYGVVVGVGERELTVRVEREKADSTWHVVFWEPIDDDAEHT